MHCTSKKRVRTSLAGDTETHRAKKLFRPGDKIEHHKSRESYFNIKSISQSYVTFLNRLENTAFDYQPLLDISIASHEERQLPMLTDVQLRELLDINYWNEAVERHILRSSQIGYLASIFLHGYLIFNPDALATVPIGTLCLQACSLVSSKDSVTETSREKNAGEDLWEYYTWYFKPFAPSLPINATGEATNFLKYIADGMAASYKNMYAETYLSKYAKQRYKLSRTAAERVAEFVLSNKKNVARDLDDGGRPINNEYNDEDDRQFHQEMPAREAMAKKEMSDLLEPASSGPQIMAALLKEIEIYNATHQEAPLATFYVFPQKSPTLAFAKLCKEMFLQWCSSKRLGPALGKAPPLVREAVFGHIVRSAMPPATLRRMRRRNAGFSIALDSILPYEQPATITFDGRRIVVPVNLRVPLCSHGACGDLATKRKCAQTDALPVTSKEMRIHRSMRRTGRCPLIPHLPLKGQLHLETIAPQALQNVSAYEAIDPGAHLIGQGHAGTSVSLKDYRRITCYKKNQKIIQNEKDTYRSINKQTATKFQESLSTASLKTSDLGAFTQGLLLRTQSWETLWDIAGREIYRRQRSQQARLRQRALQLTANEFLHVGFGLARHRIKSSATSAYPIIHYKVDEKQVVVVGDAAVGGTFKKLGSVPTKRVFQTTSKSGLVIYADEYNTSCRCSKCADNAKNLKMTFARKSVQSYECRECGHRFRRKDGDIGQCPRGHQRGTIKINVRGTLSCKSCKTTWNRDFNAAINIQKVFACYRDGNGSRPAFLSRMAMDC